jgi:multiple antibiotic resistance protein
MDQISFVFTIFFMLLGPVKLIQSFGGLTRGADTPFKRRVALWGTVIALALCMFLAAAGAKLLSNFHISLSAVRIAGGLVLLISALQATFRRPQTPDAGPGAPTALQLAAAPLAVPGIVPPAGVAAILIFMMLAPQYPGMTQAVALCLAVVMAMNFLVMYFIDAILRMPGLMIALTVLGAVLLFMQACLAIQMMLTALGELGAFKG